MAGTRAFTVWAAAVAVVLPACASDAIHMGENDAAPSTPPTPDTPPAQASGAPAATADAGVTALLDTGRIWEGGLPPTNEDAGANGWAEAGGVEAAVTTRPTTAALTIDRSTVNLGALTVGATAVGTVNVTNVGQVPSGAITLTASTGVSATGCSGTLAPGYTCVITITLTPAVAAPIDGTVTIAANPGTGTAPLQVTVIGSVPCEGRDLATPASIELGNVIVGVPAPGQTITITSRCPISDLTVTASGWEVSIDKAASTCPTALAAGASCIVGVSFLATTPGVKSDAVVISAGGAGGMTVSVPITALALMPARLAITPATTQVFVASIGSTSSAITFGVANVGDMATGAISVAITGPAAAEFNATSTCLILPPLGGCTISVTWKPATLSSTPSTATLVVTDTGPSASQVSVALAGWGGSGGPWLIITPVAADLGSVLVGGTGSATVFTMTNTSSAESGLLTVALSSPEFELISDTCSGVSLVANTSCTLAIALHPTTIGAKTAVLLVTSTGGNPAVKTLTGTGVAPPPAPVDASAPDASAG
jgi:hypothetical protein